MLNFGLSTRPAVDSIKAEYTHQAWEEIGWMEAREETMAERIAVSAGVGSGHQMAR